MKSPLIFSLGLLLIVPFTQASISGVLLTGGDCGVTQYWDPSGYPDFGQQIDVGLKQYYYSVAVSFAGRVFVIGGSTSKDVSSAVS